MPSEANTNLAAELRRLREAATSGQWWADKGQVRSDVGGSPVGSTGLVIWQGVRGYQPTERVDNADFIAFCGTHALPLAAELERLEKENAELRRLLAEAALWAAAYKFDPECGELLSQVDAAIGAKFTPRTPEAEHET